MLPDPNGIEETGRNKYSVSNQASSGHYSRLTGKQYLFGWLSSRDVHRRLLTARLATHSGLPSPAGDDDRVAARMSPRLDPCLRYRYGREMDRYPSTVITSP